VNNINKLTLSGGVLLTALFLVVLLHGIRLESAFASEYGSSQEDIAITEITPATEFSESSSKGDTLKGTVSQQNECQGNIVICQNILTKLICSERAVCIIGNLDPFLLVLPN
jgi:hypothetical protein